MILIFNINVYNNNTLISNYKAKASDIYKKKNSLFSFLGIIELIFDIF